MGAFDVAVIGIGAMGSAAAHQLAARGARVLGLEQFGPAHDRGSSHGDSRIIRQAYVEHPSYLPLVRRAYELWEVTEAESGRHLVTRTGGLMIGRANSATVSGSRLSAQSWQLPYEMLDAVGVHERFPTFNLADDEIALYEPRAGFVIPEATVEAQIDLATRHGADLRFGERVIDWAIDGDGVWLRTASDCYRAERLVICAGAWAAGLLHVEVPLSVERQIMHWFVPDAASRRSPRTVTPSMAGRTPPATSSTASRLETASPPSRSPSFDDLSRAIPTASIAPCTPTRSPRSPSTSALACLP